MYANDSRCFFYKTRNLTEEAYEAYKLDRQEYVINYFAFGAPWLKLLICVFGIITNILNIVVLTRPSVSSSINILFATLESVNLLMYPTFFYEFAMFYNKDNVQSFSDTISLMSAVSYCTYNLLICISNWLTVMVGVWRLISITYPFKASIYCSKFRSKLAVAIIIVLSLAVWSFYFFSFECLLYLNQIVNKDGEIQYEIPVRLIVNSRVADISPFFKSFYPVVVLLSYAVPCIALTIVSLCLIFRLWKARNERVAIRKERSSVQKTDATSNNQENSTGEKRVTIVLTAMILMYTLASLSESIISVMYWFSSQKYIITLFITRLAWSRYGFLLCNSLTIIFYCAMSSKLRETYGQMLYALFCKAPKSVITQKQVKK